MSKKIKTEANIHPPYCILESSPPNLSPPIITGGEEMESTAFKTVEVNKITMTPLEVSELLGVSRATIYTMVRENEIPHFKVRGKILFNQEVIINWTKGEEHNQ